MDLRVPNELLWRVGQREWRLGRSPLVMGIVNVTPDSFSDGGRYQETDTAVDHALKLVEEGADVLDIGGESTRPGSLSVAVEEEIRRVVPVIERLRPRTDKLISVDTTKAEVARLALAAGADIVNDISGLTFDPQMIPVCAASDCGVIAMHIQGTPQTMQLDPTYDDVVTEVCRFLTDRLAVFVTAGIAAERIMTDPGIGFGKTAQHNIDLLANVRRLRDIGRPTLIGHSRKRFLSKVIGRPIEERLAGTLSVGLAVAAQGADMLRVHDVRETRDSLLAWQAIMGSTQSSNACD